MQFAKDSFYLAMRDRLANLNPARKAVIDGIERPGIVVLENEPYTSAELLQEIFYLHWGGAQPVKGNEGCARPLYRLDCSIAYRTGGSGAPAADRGRKLGDLDRDLLAICSPRWTPKKDYTQNPAVDLGSNVFWTPPEFGDIEPLAVTGPTSWLTVKNLSGAVLARGAQLSVFFFPEEGGA